MKVEYPRFWLLTSALTVVDGSVLRPRILRPRDATFSSNVRDTSPLANFGTPGQTTSVNAGVTYFISGQGPHNFFGNLVNSGNIVVSQTDSLLGVGGLISTPLAVTYVGAGAIGTGGTVSDGVVVTNPGSLISLNDFGDTSLVSPSLYNWALYSMVNGGTMQWCGNGAPPTGSEYTLTCTTNTCINNGLITWEQYNAANGVAFSWTAGINTALGSATVGFNPTNNGAFRLINTDLQITQDIVSTTTAGGCFVLGNESILSLLTGTQGATSATRTFASQSIYFTSNTAGIYISPDIYALNRNFGATLYGFGTGNFIAFTEPLAILNILSGAGPFTYSGSTLTVNFLSGASIAINIGTGYTASGFSSNLNLGNLRIPLAVVAIRYNAAAPARTPPNVCVVTYPVCANPATTVTASFASTIATSSTSSSSTSSASVSVSTTAAGVTTPSVSTGITTPTLSTDISTPITATSSTPAVYNTVTVNSAGATAASTYTVPPSGTAPGTVIVVQPTNNNFVTTTYPYTGAAAFTSPATLSTVQPSGTAPGTIYVTLVDEALVTVTSPYAGSATITSTTIAPTNGVPGTVIILTPTVSRPATISTTIGPNQCVCRPRPT